MLVVAAIGLAINLLAMRVLMAGRGESMAVKGAYLEVWSDAIGSLGVIVGAVLIRVTAQQWIDPVVAIGIALWVLPRTWALLSDTLNVLLEGVPRGIDLAEVRQAIADLPGICDVHDLHVWSMAISDVNGSVHIAITEEIGHEEARRTVATLLQERFAIGHSTIQIERDPCAVEARPHR
jgi:cobalt-zinc-cadmium efflux system protein